MEYETLLEEIKMQCIRKHISLYRLSQISGVPQSTIYGVLKDKNKAQMDTLGALLKALDLKITLVPADEKAALALPLRPDYGIMDLSEEKREFIVRLIQWLKD